MTDLADSRWMPTSPHREAILEQLSRGRAHLEERGHDLSPLFVYEDGGAMELSLMRLVDGQLVAVADAALPETSTKHVDVCGTIDELKRLWEEQPELADTDPGRLLELLDHAMMMMRRIAQRMDAYREFAQAIGDRVEQMSALVHPDHAPAPGLQQRLVTSIEAGGDAVREHLPEMFDTAEAIRTIAGDSEQVLYRYRDLAIEIGTLYEGIRGARAWQPKAPQE
jgi:hypothetical protein